MSNIDEEYSKLLENTKLTDEQIEDISNQLEESIKGTELENIAKFPSNNNQEETNPEDRQDGEMRIANVEVNPETGEYKIINTEDIEGLQDHETFEEMVERLENQEVKIDESPITEEELTDYIKKSENNNSIVTDIISDSELSIDSVRILLNIVNRKLNNEEFNVFKEFPEEVKNLINKYMAEGGIPILSNEGKQFRNMISEELIQEFITNISLDRTMHDFNKEIEELFEQGTKEIADSIVGYTEERNQKYRDYANSIEDEEKKEKILNILDNIDEALNLTTLKEFSKKCKIKKFDLEKAERIYDSLLLKYKNSPYNIYDIKLAIPILLRNINIEEEAYTMNDIKAFFVCFCKQTLNMSSDNVNEHAYMYYLMYNIVLLDMNKGEKKEISEKFLNNIKEIIANIKERNTWI